MIAAINMNSIEEVKARLLDEFEAGLQPDIASYVQRFPEHRLELLDFWVVLASSDRLNSIDDEEPVVNALTDREDAIVRDLCLAVSIGPSWLEHAVDEGERGLAAIGAEMRRVRQTPYEYSGKANRSWQRISVYAWIAERAAAASSQGTVSRLELQKLAYLLEQGMSLGIFTKHKKHKLGPYDPTATYKDAEPKCIERGYLVPIGAYDFKIGPQVGEAVEYAARYLREEAIASAFLNALFDLRVNKWQMETLATVHSVASVLTREGNSISPETVREALAADQTWKKKLGRSNFSSDSIAAALATLSLLRLLD